MRAVPGKEKKGRNQEGISVKKEENFAQWYAQVLSKAELIEYYDISGCYILRPWSYSVWEDIKNFLDVRFKSIGVQNAYFPLFVSEDALTREKDHIEGFAPEVAWVTKSGQSELEKPIAVRPTSETIMYPAYAKWVRSHRDLPLRLNQWNNVVRWEFKQPTPFLRSREFLWQEGHTAFATLAEAQVEVLQVLEFYRSAYEDLLAVPVIKGRKTEKEKFAGGFYTTTVEGFIPTNGRGIQAATSHCLGQNFSRMFDIKFENEQGESALAWQNSWGFTTRSIGVMIMTHGDDRGLVLPPRIAPLQVIIVPLHFKGKENAIVDDRAEQLAAELNAAGIRAKSDPSPNHNPGWKFNHWEIKGVPLRIEVGPRDVENNSYLVARRDQALLTPVPKEAVAHANLVSRARELLDTIQSDMLERAKKARDERIVRVTEWKDFVRTLDGRNIVLAPWCDRVACEEDIKDKSGKEAKDAQEAGGFQLTASAKSLCIPFDQPEAVESYKCFCCGEQAKVWCLFGRSY
jgi:prolyl-tRNA synthetase